MYYIRLIDRDNNKVTCFQSRSEIGLDKFTTCFESKEAIVRKINLDPSYFKVVIEESTKDGLKEIPFLSSKYRYTIMLDKSTKRNDLVSLASKYDRKLLYEFFQNEYLLFDGDLSEYDEYRRNNLNKLINLYQDEVDYYKATMYDDRVFYKAIQNYCTDKFNQPIYSVYKRLYKYLKDLGTEFKYEFCKRDKIEITSILEKINEYLYDTLSIDKHSFNDSKKVNRIETTLEEDDNINDFFNKADIDDNMEELDIYLDKYGEEYKKEYIEKNKNKLFK